MGRSKKTNFIGNGALSMIRNLCLTLFVIGVLIFIITAATNHHVDPLLHHSTKITNFLVSDPNAAVKSDRGVDHVETGFMNLTDVNTAVLASNNEEFDVAAENNRECRVEDPIDCRDPDVFHSLMSFTIENFKDVHFYRFGKPDRGDNDSSCHMAWRYRPKKGKAGAFAKDYRSFTVARSDDCTYSVVGMGEYHSGVNARKSKGKGRGKVRDRKKDSVGIDNSVDMPEGGEAVSDSLPVVESEDSFSRGRYLVYSGGGDRCKSMHHYLWSFTCMLGEARYLNRTLVMDLSICLSKMYSSSGQDEEGKDFRFYFDFKHLLDLASVLDEVQFWSKWRKWEESNRLSLHLEEDVRVPSKRLADVKDTLIMRKFGSAEPDNYWYRVCEGETKHVIRRPWHLMRKSRRLMDVVSAIAEKMNGDFDSVYVERGEKASNRELWPNLDRDTSPEALLTRLQGKIKNGRNLYIATNEPDISFFNPLKDRYSTHFLDDYKDLWDSNSEWYDETRKLNNGNSVEFDGYMRVAVDTEVFLRGKKQIETFNELTNDCKDGINTCTRNSS